MRHRFFNYLCALAYASGLTACTLITGAADYKVNEDLDSTDTQVRDLQFTFTGMYPHAGKTLDVAVINDSDVLQARARIVLPPLPEDVLKYPPIDLDMDGALSPGPQSLYFFADENGDGLVDFEDNGEGKKPGIIEHVWIVPLEPDGIGTFEHVADFQLFDESDYSSLNGDLVMKLPGLANMGAGELLKCFEEKVAAQIDIVLTLKAAEKHVGLFRRYGRTAIPADGIRLRGILDGGSIYHIDVLVDGEVKKSFDKTAPSTGDLEVAPADWFPLVLTAADCD
jgi:hypothetical protein